MSTQAISIDDRQKLVESIPDPATIRARLGELRGEARLLRELLPIARRHKKLSTSEFGEKSQTADINRLAAVGTDELLRLLRTVEAEFGGNCRTATVLRQELAVRDKKTLDAEGAPQ